MEDTQKKIDKVSKDCLRTLYQTEEMGKDTMVTLSEQNEQLKRINNDLDNIDENLNFAKRVVNSMKSFTNSLLSKKARPPVLYKSSNVPDKPQPCELVATAKQEDKDDLDEMLAITQRLKQMSVDMNETIKTQTHMVDTISDKVDKDTHKLNILKKDIDSI